jgi:hypothetical protein
MSKIVPFPHPPQPQPGEPLLDAVIVRCEVGTVEQTGLPAMRLRAQSGREHDFCFSSISELERLGELITRHAARLGAIAAAAGRPH